MTASRVERFAVEAPPTLDVKLASGDVEVVAGAPGEITVEVSGADAERFDISLLGSGTVVVRPPERGTRWRGHRVLARVPPATNVAASLASADLSVHTEVADLDVHTASGEASAGDVAGDCQVATASGNVRVGRVGGALEARTASGDVVVSSVGGALEAKSASGSLRVGSAEGALEARTASGDVRIDRFDASALRAKTMSGAVRVGLAPGRSLSLELQTLSGAIRNAFEVSSGEHDSPDANGDGRVEIRTVSGDITLTRAEPAPR